MGPDVIENDKETAKYAKCSENLRQDNIADSLVTSFCEERRKACNEAYEQES